MKRRVGLLTFVIAVALAVPATAQVKKRDHRKKRRGDRQEEVVKSRRGKKKGTAPIKISSWGPKSGPVGESIRIEGKGFTRKTMLLVGGKRIRPKRIAREYIDFAWPRRWGDGSIVLRHPDMGRDVAVGTYEVIADPVIRRFSPTSGVGGTRVEIQGTGFRKGDRVLIGKLPAKIVRLSETRIVATLPQDAATDYLIVSRPGGAEGRSRGKFRVVNPAPIVTGVDPGSGAAGATVRVTGKSFTNNDQVLYGRWPMSVSGSSARWVDVVIPPKARSDEYITVKNQWGSSRSRHRFQLERPAAISRFSPSHGTIGTRVTIYGANFQASDSVRLGGQEVKILQLRSGQISVEIPRGARSGKFSVERGNVRTHSRDRFDVVYRPRVSGFSPSGGPVGTRVTITGSDFTDDADVYYGRQKLRPLERSDRALVVQIPRRARDEVFTVRTRGGEDSTRERFQVHYYSAVTGIRPATGAAGTRVVVRGRDLRRDDRFFLGEIELPVVDWNPREVTVKIPNRATTDNISWESYGKLHRSRYRFTVLKPPSIARYSPHSGPAGTRITITGDNFTRDTKVLYGNREMRVVSYRLPTTLEVTVPDEARGDKYIWVVDAGARIRSGKAFRLVVPPSIASFSPSYGTPGTEVTITGNNFGKGSRYRLGRTWLDVVRSSGNSVTVRIPNDARSGKDYFWVEQDKSAERANSPFEVTGWSTITSFRPRAAKPGQRVVISGRNFSNGTRIQFGRYDCEVVKVDRRGRWIHVLLADDANGKGHLWAIDGEHRSQSSDQLEVKGSKSERNRGRRGHRGKKRKKRRR